MTYQVSDFIIRIKNACLAKRHSLDLPYSKLNKEIGKVLVKEGFLENIKEKEISGKKTLEASIRYENRCPVLTEVEIVSKPSLRVYTKAKNVSRRKGTLGMSILSTNLGVMTEKEAKKKGVGGEFLFRVW